MVLGHHPWSIVTLYIIHHYALSMKKTKEQITSCTCNIVDWIMKNFFSFLIFLFAFMCVPAKAEVAYSYGVNAHPYEFLPTHDTPAPQGYTPFYISHYGRHGARADQGYKYYPYLIKTLTEAQQKQALTPAGDSLLKLTQRINTLYDDMPRRLLPLGLKQHAQLAERMIQRYPEVFAQDSPRVRAISSMVPRCLMSMASFTNALTAAQPAIRYTMDCGEQYQQYINCRGKLNLTEDDTPPLIDSLTSHLPRGYEHTLSLIFKDHTYFPDSLQDRFMWALYSTLIYAPCFEVESNPYLFISPATMRYYDARVTTHFYIDFCNTPYGYLRRPYAQLGLNDIIAKADSAIATGQYVADLRFGHDDPILALASLMDIAGVGDSIPYNRILTEWSGEKYTPMAANIQLVFYKNEKAKGLNGPEGDVLIKVLYNEQECHIHGLTPVESYYYRWTDVRQKWLNTHRLATYNVRYINRDPNKADKGNRAWAARRDYVIRNVLDNQLDIVGMQEVTGNNHDSITGKSQLKDLQDGLKGYTCIAYEREDTNYSYNCIFYRTDKYECLSHYSFWLSQTPEVCSKGWGSRYSRRCIVALMKDKRTHHQFYFCCAHTDFDPIEVGEKQAELLGERLTPLAQHYTPLVLVGDLNYDRYDKPSIHQVYTRYFKDSSSDHTTPTYKHWKTISDTTFNGLEIDYLYYLNMIPRHRKVITEDYGRGVPPSDHFPIYVDFQFQADPAYDVIL